MLQYDVDVLLFYGNVGIMVFNLDEADCLSRDVAHLCEKAENVAPAQLLAFTGSEV